MKTLNANARTLAALAAAALILLSLLLAPAPSLAGSDEPGTGLFIGLNAGFGGSTVEYKSDSKSIFEDPTAGAYGAVRIGYAFSRVLAVSLEGHGFGGTRERDEDWGIGATVLALTWHPGGHGFFVRSGVGCGGGDFIHPDTEELITIRERSALLFSLGYDWWVGENMSLGFSVDALDLDAGGKTGYDDDRVGSAGLNVQFNWYL